jgi:nitroimidazol reductase NimA-like FMN-containing flavoprotein (pyridoxamine 5'-phosphate oxidase superfamily)
VSARRGTPEGRGDPGGVMAAGQPDEAWIEELPIEDCLDLLRSATVGRVSVQVDDFPAIVPVNHLLVESAGDGPLVYLRTRAGTVIDRAGERVAFQIDGFDVLHRQGWSVLVRGTLRHPGQDAPGVVELESWASGRDTWLLIEPQAISGRRLHAAPREWPFHPRAYL